MPTLLIVSYHFPPSAASGSFRMLGFARHLPAHGWDVVVVAPPQLPWEPVDPGLTVRVPRETIVCPVAYPAHLPKVVRWLAPYAVWLPYARAAARRAVLRYAPDAVLTSGPPHWVHLVGRDLQKRHRLPWVADFRDPWIATTFDRTHTAWQKRWQALWERRVMRHADLILANAPNACELLKTAFPRDAARMTYLTNGYDPEAFPGAGAWQPHPGPYRILHAGELYAGRDPRPLLDALPGLPVALEFLGRILYEPNPDLPAEARKRGVEAQVRCRGQVKYAEAVREMCAADALLLIDTPGRKVGVPAKLYEYFGAGRPILVTGEPDGDTAAILAQGGVPHRIAPPGDPGKIRQAITELIDGLAGPPSEGPGEDGRLRFTRESLAGQLARLLAGLVERRGGAGR